VVTSTETTETPETTTVTDPLADPLEGEGPVDETAGDVDVPARPTYDGQLPFQPAEILWSSVRAAEAKLDEAQQRRRDAIGEHRDLRLRKKELLADKDLLQGDISRAVDELGRAVDRVEERARFGYQWFGSGNRESTALPLEFTDYQQLIEDQRRSRMIDAALRVSDVELDRVDELRRGLDADAVVLADRIDLVDDYLVEAEVAVEETEGDIEQAAIEYEAFKAGSEIYVDGLAFPIAWPYSPPTDSFGAPRMVGTDDEHWHEGIDLFAERGAPLLATERGVIAKLGVGRLGGLKFWLVGESGAEWYYAHLDSFAEGLANGQVVDAGDVLGFVGTTGNAVGTPPHLHLQLHPDGGEPVNPFPLLSVVAKLDAAVRAEGG
jgi:murein DD-endopeptidase MepM/ murein hydrolase activator NlpD